MSDTPRTDEVLLLEHNWGAIRDAAGGVIDGVTPEEARDDMVVALERLARSLERENADLMAALKGLNHAAFDCVTMKQEEEELIKWMPIVRAAIAKAEGK